LNRVLPTAANVTVEHCYLRGNPAHEILAFAEREKVDLIVMGTHGRTAAARLLMGSVAEAVLRRANCPVLTVKPSVIASSSPGTAPGSADSSAAGGTGEEATHPGSKS
jgi:hypothetical protein